MLHSNIKLHTHDLLQKMHQKRYQAIKCIKSLIVKFFENEAVFRFNKEEWRKSNDIVSK